MARDKKTKAFIQQADGGYGSITKTGPARQMSAMEKRFWKPVTKPAAALRRPAGRSGFRGLSKQAQGGNRQNTDVNSLMKRLMATPQVSRMKGLTKDQNAQLTRDSRIRTARQNQKVAADLLGIDMQQRGAAQREGMVQAGKGKRWSERNRASLAERRLAEAGASARQQNRFKNEGLQHARNRQESLADRAGLRAQKIFETTGSSAAASSILKNTQGGVTDYSKVGDIDTGKHYWDATQIGVGDDGSERWGVIDRYSKTKPDLYGESSVDPVAAKLDSLTPRPADQTQQPGPVSRPTAADRVGGNAPVQPPVNVQSPVAAPRAILPGPAVPQPGAPPSPALNRRVQGMPGVAGEAEAQLAPKRWTAEQWRKWLNRNIFTAPGPDYSSINR